MPVTLSGEIAVVGNPNDNVGVAHVFEKDMNKWTETLTKPLAYGFDNRDLDVDVGIVSNFGKTVAVDSSMNMIAIGADASMGRVVPAFLFRKTRDIVTSINWLGKRFHLHIRRIVRQR